MKKAYPKILRIFLREIRESLYDYINLERVDVNTRSFSGDTPLIKAVYWGDLRVVQALLKHGADPNADGEDDYTALHCAASQGRHRIARLLLEHGASTSATTIGNRTALGLAEVCNDPEMIRILKETGSHPTLA